MRVLSTVLFLFFSAFSYVSAQNKTGVLSYVDPTIGTVGEVLGPALPTVHLPNSMIRVFPVRRDHLDDQIRYFPLTSPSHRLANVFGILPLQGMGPDIWERKMIREEESIKPYEYFVRAEENDIQVKFVPAAKAGFFEFSFPEKGEHFLRLQVVSKKGELSVSGNKLISGVEEFLGMKAYFYAEFSTGFSGSEFKDGTGATALLLKFSDAAQKISFRYGISFISIDQAKQNLQKEITGWDINVSRQNAINIWNKTLSQIGIEGGTESQKRVFYTAMYRANERMVDINEYGKYYSAYDRKVHETNEPFYVDSWIYDFSIGLFPLQMILNPEKQKYFIRSYIKMYEQGGWMPGFALIDGDWPAMTGNYTAVWMNDAWSKGIRDFDVKKAYEGLKKNALEATILPWQNGPAVSWLDSFYNRKGYLPGLYEHEKEYVKEITNPWERRQSVSVTLETSYGDWAVAQLSEVSGNAKDKALLMQRAQNYKKMYRADKGFMWPRDSSGNWIEPMNPSLAGREYYTENNAYTFNWHARQDLENLFDMMGGKKAAEAKLDQLFREDIGTSKPRFWVIQPDASGLVGQFSMGNEMGFFIPYLYNNLGSPWKTQKRIRMLLETWFPDNVFGYPGDEDGGGMSPFIIFSMVGFFPVTPGIPIYHIGSPVFEKATINLPGNKQMIIEAKQNSAENKYIQSATLNGKPLNRSWFTHEELMNGGRLVFVMGKTPNKKWGADETTLPPSFLEIQQKDIQNRMK